LGFTQVDVSWDLVDGLALYVNGQRVDQRTSGVTNHETYDVDRAFYVGRSTADMSRRHYASAIFDDLQLWEAKRDYLISLNLINPGLFTAKNNVYVVARLHENSSQINLLCTNKRMLID